MTQLSHDQIAQRSFMIWEQEGRPHGQDLDHWLQAERELTDLFARKPAPRKKAAASAAKAASPAKSRKAATTTKTAASTGRARKKA